MGLYDRDYNRAGNTGRRGGGGRGDFGEGGGFSRAFKRTFIEGDNILNWAVPFFRVPDGVPGIGGIRVSVHILYIAIIAIQIVQSIDKGSMGVQYAVAHVITLFLLVLLHEFGHCLACRRVGGQADRVLMWPLGGLAECLPPHNWKASLVTTIGGPAVNLLLIPVFAGVLIAMGCGKDVLLYNPLNTSAIRSSPELSTHWHMWIWSAYNANLILFLFNVVVFMFPMDGGRIFQELLWSRLGYKRSMIIATTVGIGIAVVMGLYGFSQNNMSLINIALFGGFICFTQRRTIAMMEDEPAWASSIPEEARYQSSAPSPTETDRAYKAALKKQLSEQERQREVDRILGKIREQGMPSLTRSERNMLKDETERQRERH